MYINNYRYNEEPRTLFLTFGLFARTTGAPLRESGHSRIFGIERNPSGAEEREGRPFGIERPV